MEQTKWKTLDHKRLDILFFAGMLFGFLAQVFLMFSPIRMEGVHTIYFAPLIAAMMVYLVVRIGVPRTPVLLLPPVIAIWFLITRLINGDWYLRESYPYVYFMLFSCCVLFLSPFLADKEGRGRLLSGGALVYSVIFGVIAWIAVIASLTGVPWVNPLDGNAILGLNEDYANPYRLNILGIHPNISATFFYTSLCLLFYLFFHTKKLWLRIGYGALAVGLYLAICMTGSISAIIVTGVIIGMVLFALIFHNAYIKKLRVPLAALTLVLVMIVVVLTYPLVIQATTKLYVDVQEKSAGLEWPLIVSASAEEAQQETSTVSAYGETNGNVFVQERLVPKHMIGNMRARFIMYSSAFLSVADRPLTLLIGELHQAAMDRSARMIDYPMQNHLHNAFLQTLVVGGGISFLMSVVFTVLLIIYMLRLFFAKGVPFDLRMLVLAPVGLLCHSMTEPLLFIDTRVGNLLFFFLAGMIIVYTSELCPPKKKQKGIAE